MQDIEEINQLKELQAQLAHSNNAPFVKKQSTNNNDNTKAIHIAFTKDCILDAINQFHVNGKPQKKKKNYYTRDTYVQWGLIK